MRQIRGTIKVIAMIALVAGAFTHQAWSQAKTAKEIDEEIKKIGDALKKASDALKPVETKIANITKATETAPKEIKDLTFEIVDLQKTVADLQSRIDALRKEKLSKTQKDALDKLETDLKALSAKVEGLKLKTVEALAGKPMKAAGLPFALPPTPTVGGQPVKAGVDVKLGGMTISGTKLLIEVFHFLRVLSVVLLDESPVKKEIEKEATATGFDKLSPLPTIEIFILSRDDAKKEVQGDGQALPPNFDDLGAFTYCYEDHQKAKHIKVKFFLESLDKRYDRNTLDNRLFTEDTDATGGFAAFIIHELTHVKLDCFYVLTGTAPPFVTSQNGVDTQAFLDFVAKLFKEFVDFFLKKIAK